MKKNYKYRVWYNHAFKKTFLVMRLVLVISLVCIIQSFALDSYTQNSKISISVKEMKLDDILMKLESETDYRFAYNKTDINVNQVYTIDISDAQIKEVLDKLFTDKDISYKIIDQRQIILSKSSGTYTVSQQQLTISGKVTDSSGAPLPGVTVMVKGTTTGTITDFDGKYTLPNVPGDATLVFSFVGMRKQEVQSGDNATVNVIMISDVIGVDEVVVTGYSTQTKASLTGSVATVNSDQLVEIPAANIAQRLQGRISGVTIVNSHTPGGDATVRVRGLGTINNSDPLYVIDGVPTKAGLSVLNPNDIESITVLKDAASAAIYGANGANGVILITTIKGTSGEPKVSISTRTGISQITKTYDLLNTQEYGELLWLEAQNDGIAPGNDLYGFGSAPDIPDYILPARAQEGDASIDPALYSYDPDNLYLIFKANKEGTDWFNEVLRPAVIQEYNLNVTGGSEKGGYAFSGGYMGEEGFLNHTSFERFSVRSNAHARFKDWLEIGESLGVILTSQKGYTSDNNEYSVISEVYRMQPIIPVYDIMGNFAGTKAPTTGNGDNPVALLYRNRNDQSRNLRTIGNLYGQADIITGLKFKSLFGFDYLTYGSKNISLKNPEMSEASLIDGLQEGSSYNLQWNWQNLFIYNNTFANVHKISALAGMESVNHIYRYINAGRSVYYSDDINYMVLNSGESDQTNSGSGSEWSSLSYFTKVNYDYKGKYLLEATFRRDGSSRFGQNQRWGNFPAASIGWRVSEEQFMDRVNWIDNLKLRAAWGQTGNSEIGNYNGFTTFRTSNEFSYYGITGSNTSTTSGFDSNAFGNSNAKWETTTTTDFGLDFTILNSSLSVTLDYWTRKTTDMLYQIPQPSVMGLADMPFVNIGNMGNKGFDFSLDYNNEIGDLKYNISFNFSHYKNEIKKLSGKDKSFYSGPDFRGFMYTAYNVGTSFPEFYGYKVDGIFQTQTEADAWPTTFGADGTYNEPGHLKYVDVTGDGVVDDKDRTWIGSPHPDFTAGLTFDIKYKNWDLTAFMFMSYGNEIVNYTRRLIDYTKFNGNRSKDRLYRSWGSPYLKDNSKAILAKAEKLADEGNQQPSSQFVEDGSFVRLKNLQLGYTIPQSVLNKLKLSKLRIYLQATNLFTITEYSGLDPEINATGTYMGIDQGAWPTPKQFYVGVNINL